MDKVKRIAELEAIIKQRDARISELTADVHSSWSAVSRANENSHEWAELLDSVRDAYARDDEFWVRHEALCDERDELIKKWNKFVPEYNRAVAVKRRDLGRPLAASRAQRSDLLKRRKAGELLRSIADETYLGFKLSAQSLTRLMASIALP